MPLGAINQHPKRLMTLIRRLQESLCLSKTFVIEPNRTWTYSDLHSWSRGFSEKVHSAGATKLLICLPAGFYAYAAVLSSYLCGVTFCVVSPTQPAQRRRFVAGDFAPDLVLCDTPALFDETHAAGLCLNPSELLVADGSATLWHTDLAQPTDLAYVLYTSGSSGTPKGVKITRRGLDALVCWAIETFGLRADDIYGQYAPLHFDMSMFDIFGGAAVGAALVPFVATSERLFPGKLIMKHGITFWNSVPQILEVFERAKQFDVTHLASLRAIKLGGDKTYEDDLTKLFAVLPNARVFLTYGPTETTIFCAYLTVNRHSYKQFSCNGLMALGDAVPGWNILLNAAAGEVGEIVVFGDNIGAGYLNEQAGQSRFATATVLGVEHAAFFTGDYAVMNRGRLFFRGRRDNQVKINGNRIDLSEIEMLTKRCGCEAALALLTNQRIVLFIVSTSIDVNDLHSQLASVLPAYALPSIIHKLEALPYNESGKVDTAMLRRQAELL